MSFYEFICQGGKVPVISSASTTPSWPLPEDYCETLLLLHYPNWRTISDIKPQDFTWSEKMAQFLLSDECPNFVKADVERAKQKQNINYDSDTDEGLPASSQQPPWMGVIRPDAEYDCLEKDDFFFDDGGDDYNWSFQNLPYPSDLGAAWLTETIENVNKTVNEALQIPDVNTNTLNEDQKLAFNIIMSKVLESADCTHQVQPLRMIVSGTAGSGKSYLIKCSIKSIRLFYNTNQCIQVVCPTGNSANIIGGSTLHSFFKVPTTFKGADLSQPSGAIGDQIQRNCEGLKVLLVDERSMIGAITLGWMEHNCRYGVENGANCDQSWGGLPVVVFLGDDVQLPPVRDSPVYYCHSSVPLALHGVLVWQEFDVAVSLNTIVRQNSEETVFKNALLDLREYKLSPLQAKWLQSFQFDQLEKNYGKQHLKDLHTKALFVFPTHEEVWQHNKGKILEANVKYPIAKVSILSRHLLINVVDF